MEIRKNGVPGLEKANDFEDDELEHAAAECERGAEEELDDGVLGLVILEQLLSVEEQPEPEVGAVQHQQQH